MPLVNYSDSETSSSRLSDEEAEAAVHRTRKRKNSGDEGQDALQKWSGTKRKPYSANSSTTTNTLPVNTQPPARKPAFSPLPSLPPTFHSLYATSTRSSTLDDPALHSGRVRQIPHVQGNWPTHIYLEWFPSSIELSHLTHLLDTHIGRTTTATATATTTPPSEFPIYNLLHSPLLAPLPLHISLSVPLTLPTALKQPFLDTLSQAITTSCTVKPFSVTTTGTGELDWVCNYDQTRWFLVLRLTRPKGDELNRLLRVCNRVAAGFGMRTLYGKEEAGQKKAEEGEASLPSRLAGGLGRTMMEEGKTKSRMRTRNRNQKERKTRYMAGRRGVEEEEEASGAGLVDRSECFHISIAWTLQDPRRVRGEGGGGAGGGGGDCGRVVGPSKLDEKREMEIHFDVVKVKIGNMVHDLPLARAPATTSM